MRMKMPSPLTYTSLTRGEEKIKKERTLVAVRGSHFMVHDIFRIEINNH